MTTTVETENSAFITSGEKMILDWIMKRSPEEFRTILVTTSNEIRLLWTAGVRQWLYDRKKELIEAVLKDIEALDLPPLRKAELFAIRASAFRRHDKPHDALRDLKIVDETITQVDDEIARGYLIRKSGGESAKVSATLGDYADAARASYRITNACAGDALKKDRLRARREGALFALSNAICHDHSRKEQELAYEQLRDADALLLESFSDEETKFLVWLDLMLAEWRLDISNRQAFEWLQEIERRISEDENLRRAYEWSYRVVYAGQSVHAIHPDRRTQGIQLAENIAFDSKIPMEYRADAALALAQLKAGDDPQGAITICASITDCTYNGPASALAEKLYKHLTAQP